MAVIDEQARKGQALNIAGHAIEEANTPRLDGVLAGANWNDDTKLGWAARPTGSA